MNRTAKVLAIVLAIVLVGGGFYLAYQNGFDAGAVTAASASEGGDGTTVVVDRHWGRGGYGFFPLGFLFPLLFLFLIFGAFRGRWGGSPRGGYGPPWGGTEHMEKRLEEWHQKAHQQPDQPS